jgi:lysozyme
MAAVVAATIVVVIKVRRDHAREAKVGLPHGCRLGPTTPGIDVSYYQGDITWPRVARAGVKFAFIRVADGTDIFDTKFEANWRGAGNARILRGAYQYFRADQSPTDQADVVIRALRKYGMGELPPVIDVEDSAGLPLSTVAARAQAWIARIRTELKIEPIVYTNPGMWAFRSVPELASQTLWIAHYTEGCPELPRPFERWSFWQYTDNGRVPGIEGPVDLDVFDGDLMRRAR